ncbi:MAG: hypothetical protein PHS54_06310 [Clostridia bacterium]|nr:hypothetical protein [Clostridia bacterium]
MKYPKIIYVQKQNPATEDEFLETSENGEDLNDGVVAVYELRKTVKKETNIVLK